VSYHAPLDEESRTCGGAAMFRFDRRLMAVAVVAVAAGALA